MILYGIVMKTKDEMFMVFKGTLLVDFRDGKTVEVKEGEILIIPKGVEHKLHILMENLYLIYYLVFKNNLTYWRC